MARPRDERRAEPVPDIHRKFAVEWCAECLNSALEWSDWAAHWKSDDQAFLERKMLEFGLTQEDIERAREGRP